MNIAEFLDWCQAEDPIERINPDYVMISRVNVLLRGMGNAFGLQLNSADFWNAQAKTLLKSKNISLDE
jgi:aarF domain-containing kinase